jgi:hypothetical protein
MTGSGRERAKNQHWSKHTLQLDGYLTSNGGTMANGRASWRCGKGHAANNAVRVWFGQFIIKQASGGLPSA